MNGKWDSIQPAFWECGSHGLNREDALATKGHLLLALGDRWWEEGTSTFANVLKDFRIIQVRVQRRSAPALMDSGLECSVSDHTCF